MLSRFVFSSQLILSVLLAGTVVMQPSPARMRTGAKTNCQKLLIASKTERFQEKEGFERKRKDIINTLKDNDVARFQTLLDGMSQGFDVDKTLKETGPFTLFAPNDKAFKKMPDDDRQSLWANKSKLKQVMQYMIVKGNIKGSDLRSLSSVQTLEGHKAKVSVAGGDIYIDKALILTSDIPCSNGIIHVLDDVIMPPLSK